MKLKIPNMTGYTVEPFEFATYVQYFPVDTSIHQSHEGSQFFYFQSEVMYLPRLEIFQQATIELFNSPEALFQNVFYFVRSHALRLIVTVADAAATKQLRIKMPLSDNNF